MLTGCLRALPHDPQALGNMDISFLLGQPECGLFWLIFYDQREKNQKTPLFFFFFFERPYVTSSGQTNLLVLRSTDLGSLLHLESPYKTVPRLVFDQVGGRKYVLLGPGILGDHLTILSLTVSFGYVTLHNKVRHCGTMGSKNF